MYLTVERDDLYQKNARKLKQCSVNKRNAGSKSGPAMASVAGPSEPPLLYSRKYWQELSLAVEPKITIARILADFQ